MSRTSSTELDFRLESIYDVHIFVVAVEHAKNRCSGVRYGEISAITEREPPQVQKPLDFLIGLFSFIYHPG